jgi:hypothetical protein
MVEKGSCLIWNIAEMQQKMKRNWLNLENSNFPECLMKDGCMSRRRRMAFLMTIERKTDDKNQ